MAEQAAGAGWKKSWAIGAAFGITTWILFLAYFAVRIGLDTPPRAVADEPDYDTIAWELSQGRGFQMNYLDPDFRRPYDEAAEKSDIFRLESRRVGVTTYRPPLFPAAVAVGNALFGRQFWFMRGWNLAAMAACSGLLVAVVHRLLGLRVAVVAWGLFVLVDARTRLYGSAFLTEAMTALETALLLLVIVYGIRGRLWQTCGFGVLAGLAILTRSMLVFWVPWLCVALVLALRAEGANLAWRRIGWHLAAFIVTLVLVLLPWSIWNCRVLGRFMPLGAQGAVELSAGWSDVAWNLRGEWRSPQPAGYFENHLPLSIVEREVEAAGESVARAKAWALANPLKAAALVPIKIVQEFRPKDWQQGVILLLAVVGAFGWTRVAGSHAESQRLRTTGLLLVAAQALAVGLTWTVPESRFVVPLLFVEHLFAAAGVAVIVTWSAGRVTTTP